MKGILPFIPFVLIIVIGIVLSLPPKESELIDYDNFKNELNSEILDFTSDAMIDPDSVYLIN